jgi:hypothetical protein
MKYCKNNNLNKPEIFMNNFVNFNKIIKGKSNEKSKKITSIRLILIIIAFFSSNIIGISFESSIAYAYTVGEAVRDALKNNFYLKSTEKNLEIAKIKSKKAFTTFMPKVVASSTIRNNKYDYDNIYIQPDFKDDNASIQLKQNLFSSGGDLANVYSAKSSYKAANIDFMADKSNFIISVIDTYNAVLLYREKQKTATEYFKSLEVVVQEAEAEPD